MWKKGIENIRAKLNDADIREIRRLANDGRSQRSLARQFGVYPRTISSILRGISWRHV